MTEATSLPGEGPSILGRCNCDTLSPKRRGDVIRDGTGACRRSRSNRKARCRRSCGDVGEGKTSSQRQGGGGEGRNMQAESDACYRLWIGKISPSGSR